MSDVTAVVLTVGEVTTARAIASVRRQTLPVREIVFIEHVTPFHKALNTGAARTITPFFIQVDADMILDVGCVAALRECFTNKVGIAVGRLRDPLVGRVVGVKMFRTECFRLGGFPDSISPDTDFGKIIAKHGWSTVYASQQTDPARPDSQTFGEHQPNYTPYYTLSKYLLEGRRYRYRKAFWNLNSHFNKLEKSAHPAALIAQLALAHGIFLDAQRDLLIAHNELEEWRGVEPFLNSTARVARSSACLMPFWLSTPKGVFRKFCKLGTTLRKQGAFTAFCRLLNRLHRSKTQLAWIARIGLCHGVFAAIFDEQRFQQDWRVLAGFLPEYHFGSFKRDRGHRGIDVLRGVYNQVIGHHR